MLQSEVLPGLCPRAPTDSALTSLIDAHKENTGHAGMSSVFCKDVHFKSFISVPLESHRHIKLKAVRHEDPAQRRRDVTSE